MSLNESQHNSGLITFAFEENQLRKMQICDEILHSLPDWFGIESSIKDYIEDVKTLPFLKITRINDLIGFCALKIHYNLNCDLFVLGIRKEFHRTGVGKKMMSFIEDFCRNNKIAFMTVKTLSERHPDESYKKTRLFYEACGFKPMEEFPELWGEENPCLYMIKVVY